MLDATTKRTRGPPETVRLTTEERYTMPIGRHRRFEWYSKVGGWTGRGIVPHPVNQKRATYAEADVRGTGSPPLRRSRSKALLLSDR